MQFIIDSREKKPYELAGAKVAPLKTGDYSIVGYEDTIAIERKSYDDIYGCLTEDQKRFKAQLKRLGAMPHKMLLIDTSSAAFLMGHVFHKLTGDDALYRLTSMTVSAGVPFCFVGRNGTQIVASLLLQFWKLENGQKEGTDRGAGRKRKSASARNKAGTSVG